MSKTKKDPQELKPARQFNNVPCSLAEPSLVDRGEPLVEVSSCTQMEAPGAKGDRQRPPGAPSSGPAALEEAERQAARVAMLLEARATRAVFPQRIPIKRAPHPLVAVELTPTSTDSVSDFAELCKRFGFGTG